MLVDADKQEEEKGKKDKGESTKAKHKWHQVLLHILDTYLSKTLMKHPNLGQMANAYEDMKRTSCPSTVTLTLVAPSTVREVKERARWGRSMSTWSEYLVYVSKIL